jgi:hypothetical protein
MAGRKWILAKIDDPSAMLIEIPTMDHFIVELNAILMAVRLQPLQVKNVC